MGDIPQLPQELVDQTIDHLWDDRASLVACSMSCGAWLPSARTHLFRDIVLTGADPCRRFENLIEGTPELVHFVRRLSIKDPRSAAHGQAWLTRLPALLAKLGRLSSLELRDMHFDPGRGITSDTLAPLARLDTLVLKDVAFNDYADVQSLLAAAPAVRILAFDRVGWPTRLHDNHESPWAGAGGTLSELKSLLIESWAASTMVRSWLLASSDALSLHSLTIRWRESGNMDVLNDLLGSCGPSLEHLSIELPSTVKSLGEELTLQGNRRLRSLHIDGLILPGNYDWVATLLGTITSPTLQKASISMLVLRRDALSTIRWPELDAVLARPQFRGVAITFNVTVAIWSKNDKDEVKNTIVALLPGLAGTGRLAVQCF